MPTWTPLYARSVGRTVVDEYKAFLDELNSTLIDTSSVVDKAKLRRLDGERTMVRSRLDRFEIDANRRWQRYVAITSPVLLKTRVKWEDDQGISGQRENYQRELASVEGLYLVEANKVGGDLLEVGRAVIGLGSQTQQIPLPSTPELVPLGKDYWEWFYRTFLDGDIDKFKREQSPWSVSVQEGQSLSTSFTQAWSVSVSVGWGLFFSASGNVEHEDKTQHFEEQTSSISISFKNIKPFNILRGAWFKGGLINRFADRLGEKFWGMSGRLNLIPTQLVLGHGMAVDIKTSESMRDFIYSRHHSGGGAGFGIGPFRLGGGASSTTTYEETRLSKTETGLKIEDTSGRASVVAVLSQRTLDLLARPSPNAIVADTEFEAKPEDVQLGAKLRLEAMRAVSEPSVVAR